MAWGPQPQQIGNLALVRGGAGGRQLVAVLRVGDTSWVAPKASKYTFYVYAPGANLRGGDLVVATRTLSKGATFSCAVGGGSSFGGSTDAPVTGNTTLTGGGISIVAGAAGATSSGGDTVSVGTTARSGGDGSIYGPFSMAKDISANGRNYSYGQHPGGPTNTQTDYQVAIGGNGEIRIVDETP